MSLSSIAGSFIRRPMIPLLVVVGAFVAVRAAHQLGLKTLLPEASSIKSKIDASISIKSSLFILGSVTALGFILIALMGIKSVLSRKSGGASGTPPSNGTPQSNGTPHDRLYLLITEPLVTLENIKKGIFLNQIHWELGAIVESTTWPKALADDGVNIDNDINPDLANRSKMIIMIINVLQDFVEGSPIRYQQIYNLSNPNVQSYPPSQYTTIIREIIEHYVQPDKFTPGMTVNIISPTGAVEERTLQPYKDTSS